MPDAAWHTQIGVFTSKNFIFNDTIRANISWQLPYFDEAEAVEYVRTLEIEKHLQVV